MEKSYIDSKGRFRRGHVELFLQISIDIYHRLLKYENELVDLRKKNDSIAQSDEGLFPPIEKIRLSIRISTLEKEKYKSSIEGIIILASYYEALINEIGRIELGSKYYENLDKLKVSAKWEIVLKLIYSESLQTDSQYYESMIKIIKERNDLVHYKTKTIENPTLRETKKGYEIANQRMSIFTNAIETLTQFHNDILKIDCSKGLLKSFQFPKEIKRI
ncbi:hypothetical protein MK851_00280 [Tenacibaculum sp. 1B UA]|uniref:hypothetical protein n=1 Tax=Tenacibaculum sp. 1B UA TaxID=2922252 RepID=UPI002A23A647|nr:hypothetical protein [Tenacibaculum sp. 1B UA]MDX8552064.1 hypothetical protein [Tenacibaculum sp. 1B UA]